MQVYRPVDQSSAAARITFGPIAVTITRRMVSCCGYLTLLACVLALFMIPNSHGRVTGASAAEEGTLDPPASGNPSLLPPEDLPLVGENEPGQPPLLPLPPPPPELEPRATSHLSRVKCIPKVCSADKHFVSDWNVLAEHSSFTVLSSTPGSGNTFVRSIVEEGTRVWSGSVYHDRALERTYGFRGEMVNPWATAHSRFSVIKSHFPMFNQKVLPHRVTGAIHILRAPFDAMLSEFNREYGNGHTSSASAWAVRGRLAPWCVPAWCPLGARLVPAWCPLGACANNASGGQGGKKTQRLGVDREIVGRTAVLEPFPARHEQRRHRVYI
jgi:hypothetical protein